MSHTTATCITRTEVMEMIKPPGKRPKGTSEQRFWWKVDKTPGFGPNKDCWRWIAALDRKGYGLFNPAKSSICFAHRFSYLLANGKLPKDKQFVMHICDNPSCVNPEHLIAGTNADNVRDMVNKGRHGNQLVTHCPRGHAYTEENTLRVKAGRSCKTCANKASLAYYYNVRRAKEVKNKSILNTGHNG